MVLLSATRFQTGLKRLGFESRNVLLALGLAWILSLPFPFSFRLRFFMVLLTLPGFLLSLHTSQKKRQSGRILLRYQDMLAFLSSRLAIGETLDKALLNYVQEQKNLQISLTDPSYWLFLRSLSRQLSLKGNVSSALESLLDAYPCPSVRPVLLALPRLKLLGGRLDRFARDSHQTLTELMTLEQEILSEHSQKMSEAAILSFMPFVLATGSWQLLSSSDQIQVGRDPRTALLYGLVFLAASTALVWTWSLGQKSPEWISASSSTSLHRKSGTPDRLSLWLEYVYQKLDTKGISRPVQTALLQQADESPRYYQIKVRLMIITGALAQIWILAGAFPFWMGLVIPIAASLIQDIVLVRDQKRRTNSYRILYPAFQSWLVNSLQAGLSVTRILQEAGDLWHSNSPGNVLNHDLQFILQQLSGGRPSSWITNQLAKRNPVPEIQAFWHGLSRYEREGSSEMLQLLALQSENARLLLRTGRRRQLEEKSLHLLLPMLIDLLAVLALAAWPSLQLLSQ